MITRVEISGFKTFTDFAVDLAPLSVIAGANASGKSNFLDALRVIQGITAGKTLDAIIRGRGSAKDFFTKYDGNHQSKTITIAVELMVPPVIEHNKASHQLDGNRFRYELRLIYEKGLSNPYQLNYEKLSFIDREEDHWARLHARPDQPNTMVRYRKKKEKVILIRGVGLNNDEAEAGYVSDYNDETSLNQTAAKKNPHIKAVRQSLLNISYVTLNDPDNFSNFHNRNENKSLILQELASLATMRPEDMHHLSTRVFSIAKPIKSVTVEVDDFGRISVVAKDQNGARYLADSLSEGTLRTIALAALIYSRAPQRTILLEEPESGVDPRMLNKFVELLRDLATDLLDDVPFVQVICTTHSPALLERIVETNQPEQVSAYLASIKNKVVERNGERVLQEATDILPIVRNITAPISESRLERATRYQAQRYMESGRMENLQDA